MLWGPASGPTRSEGVKAKQKVQRSIISGRPDVVGRARASDTR
jgi:hypothetical protein